METEKELTQKIMRRVHMVYVLRQALRPRTRYIGLGVIALIITASVSLKDIAANALSAASSYQGFLHYVADALITTEVFVQVAALCFLALTTLAIRDICLYCITTSLMLVRKRA